MGAGYHGGFGNTKGAKATNSVSAENNSQSSKENQSSDIAEQNNREDYLRNELSKSSPVVIPKLAKITEQSKVGYDQVKYTWTKGNFKYVARWHTRTPGAPTNQGPTWVIERVRSGIGSGIYARRRQEYILVGKYKWVTKKVSYDAINARKNGTATKEQEEMLNHGHWKA